MERNRLRKIQGWKEKNGRKVGRIEGGYGSRDGWREGLMEAGMEE